MNWFRRRDILQLNVLAEMGCGESKEWMSVHIEGGWRSCIRIWRYLEKGRVELSNSTNDYEAKGYMHVKVCWEQYKCWLKVVMTGEGEKTVHINIPAGFRGES